MKIKEYADKLNGVEYPMNDCGDLFSQATKDNIVIVFGHSDDLLELRGAIGAEYEAYNGAEIFLNKDGVIENQCEFDDCPYFKNKIVNAPFNIKAVWCPKDSNTSWEILSNIPHLKFEVVEDSEVYCIGIVFDIDSLKETP